MIGKVYISEFDINENDVNRFWNLVDIKGEEECWNWTGKLNKDKYGKFVLNVSQHFRRVSAHRVAYKISRGILPNDKFICHHCDNPRCVNPKHLYAGTYTDNSNDRVKRGRSNAAKGEKQGSSKLKEFQVLEIRKRVKEGERQIDLCKEYKVDSATLNHAVKRVNWKHI